MSDHNYSRQRKKPLALPEDDEEIEYYYKQAPELEGAESSASEDYDHKEGWGSWRSSSDSGSPPHTNYHAAMRSDRCLHRLEQCAAALGSRARGTRHLRQRYAPAQARWSKRICKARLRQGEDGQR